ncbi:MAG TPA: AAA family ATPase [Phycisphaerae bacterium]|jgi:predicted ATPase|nr:AAA family ATPase [Phycisphaerae bacterium]HOB76010.1 AAA family ATPase [Phycisphaerae bacterium]HOJ53489.1 AAA family ATPase [Phycisphaerae bacterium]HOL25354.1 AAA family ATPase [Phycisphaerae bacterium]HPP21858.1 AAA family ATPase [Phycisphaerae bacterium]
MMRLKSLYLSGYKSFAFGPPTRAQDGAWDYGGREASFGDVTVLVGANGAGKSNVVSFFRMMGYLATGALQQYIGQAGTAESILHYGSAVTPRIDAELVFGGDGNTGIYKLSLSSAAPDTLIFTREQVIWQREGDPIPYDSVLGSGHRESLLESNGQEPCRFVHRLLRDCRVYQFHDTSEEAKIRKGGYIEDARYLRSDAGNLAAYLYALRQSQPAYYDRIVRTIRQVCPQFQDFELAPSVRNEQYILLNWREAHRPDYLMGPHQLSDGTLRFMAMATLLLQPPERLPSVIVLDEPELGQHPAAIAVLTDLIRGVTDRSQVILATQSPTLVNHFRLDEIRPLEFRDGQSFFLDLNPEDYRAWLEDYTTGELWQKDVFGGSPRHG